MMSKSAKFIMAVFLAMGSMFSFAPRQSKLPNFAVEPIKYQNGIAKHFEAVWRHIGNTVVQHG